MHLSTAFLSVGVPLISSVLAIPTPDSTYAALEPRQSRGFTPHCVEGVHMIIGSGHHTLKHKGYGLLEPTIEAIKTAVPHSTNWSVPYPKDSTDYPSAIGEGVSLMTSNIEWYSSGCPDVPLVLIGYSEGSIVTTNTLCGESVAGHPQGTGLDPSYAGQIIAVIGYGDETYVSGQSFDRGTCTTGHGVQPRQDPAACGEFAANMREYCDIGDPECCGGDDPSVHYQYMNKYDSEVAEFVASQYSAFSKRKMMK